MFGIDDAIIGSAAGAGISGLFSMGASSSSAKGIASMNETNYKIATENRAWQERMSNTAHTREVEDLRNAGLNPILSATGGSGASSPGGSVATMQNTQEQAAPIKAQLANLAANTAKTIMDSHKSKAEAKLNVELAQKTKYGTAPGTDIPNATIAEGLSNAKNTYNKSSISTKVPSDIAMSGPMGIINSAKKLMKG